MNFTKLDQVNTFLKPHFIRAFSVASMKTIDFVDVSTGETLHTANGYRVKDLTIAMLEDIVLIKQG